MLTKRLEPGDWVRVITPLPHRQSDMAYGGTARLGDIDQLRLVDEDETLTLMADGGIPDPWMRWSDVEPCEDPTPVCVDFASAFERAQKLVDALNRQQKAVEFHTTIVEELRKSEDALATLS